ncbi:MAG: peptide chain release factor 2 [Candidatus Margulisiibacteriota bacterium]
MKEEILKKQKELLDQIEKIGEYLRVNEKREKIKKLQEQTSDPNLWSDQNKARVLLQELKMLEKTVKEWEDARNRIEDAGTLLEMAGEKDLADIKGEIEVLGQRISSLEVETLLSGPYDANNAILSINAGAGGTDAQDWAQILLRMYTRWSESKEYRVEMPEISYADAGLKSATLLITGPYAYGYLKCENGVHRLVRISPFSSEGKRHTSFASVEVIPEITEDINVEIDPNDLRVDTYRASGPGGQHVNKTDSAIRITHEPTGIVTQCQSERSQHANRDTAMRILKAKLYELMLEQHKEKIDELRGSKKAIEWGSQIRSYVFQPYTMVKDHRTSAEVGNVEGVIDGDIDPFIEAFLKQGKKE